MRKFYTRLYFGRCHAFSCLWWWRHQFNFVTYHHDGASDKKVITFPTAGTHPSICTVHPAMKATVIVH